MKVIITLFAATLLATGALAANGPQQEQAGSVFQSLDKNADQQISKSEAAADQTLSEQFAAIDTNGDGYISKSEYAAALAKSSPRSR